MQRTKSYWYLVPGTIVPYNRTCGPVVQQYYTPTERQGGNLIAPRIGTSGTWHLAVSTGHIARLASQSAMKACLSTQSTLSLPPCPLSAQTTTHCCTDIVQALIPIVRGHKALCKRLWHPTMCGPCARGCGRPQAGKSESVVQALRRGACASACGASVDERSPFFTCAFVGCHDVWYKPVSRACSYRTSRISRGYSTVAHNITQLSKLTMIYV